MQQHLINHPLNGIKLPDLVQTLVDCYGWDILAAQININCFKSNPSVASSVTFLRKTDWARHRLEAFYLYRFRQFPLPSEIQHALPPREREVDISQNDRPPAALTLDDPEFFDDPNTGWQPTPKDGMRARHTRKQVVGATVPQPDSVASSSGKKTDPWSKWRAKQNDD
ncbi:VF530 family protein [Arenicella chitinivorans]|nr:VF530 family DNA-binding protein [Arenicella chitinivorans]